MEDVPRPDELRRHGDGCEAKRDISAGVERRIQVMFVVKNMLPYRIVDQGEDYRETTEAKDHQQGGFVPL